MSPLTSETDQGGPKRERQEHQGPDQGAARGGQEGWRIVDLDDHTTLNGIGLQSSSGEVMSGGT